ncbi:MAG TPA: hypothetical protein VFE45_15040 [Coriobacteriia bacterium]|nr:hypothetical protein [Coriobacteriia bacterium]
MVGSGSHVSAKALTVAALRNAREFKALAAVAAACGPSEAQAARVALAASTDREDALAWLMAVNEDDSDWTGLTEFPERVRVPDSLRSRVKSLAKTASSNPNGHTAAAMSQLLPKIEPAALRWELSRLVLRGAAEGTTIRAAARGCLSGSADAADRNALVADLAGQLAPERIKRLDALGVLKTGRETAQSKKALRELRDSGASGADSATVGRLAARLPNQWVADWFTAGWPNGRAIVGAAEFGREVGVKVLLAILSKSPQADVVIAACEASNGLDLPEDALVIAKAVHTGQQLAVGTLERFLEQNGQPRVRTVSWQILLAEHGEGYVDQFAAAASLEDLVEAARSHSQHISAVDRFARLLGKKANESASSDDAHSWLVPTPEWERAVLDVAGSLGEPFLERLPDSLARSFAVPSALAACVMDHDKVAAQFADHGFTSQLTAKVSTPVHAETLLRTAGDLTEAQVAELLTIVGTDDLLRWTRALGHVAGLNPAWVHSQAHAVIDPLSAGVEEDMAASGVVVATVTAALDAGMATARENTPRLLTLLNHPDDAVVAVSARWAGEADVPMDAKDLVNGIVHADEARDPRHPQLGALRRSLATHLCTLAASQDSVAGKRVEYLALAQTASSDTARETAFTLAASKVALLAVAAADILATTQGLPRDAARLQGLLSKERRKDVRSQLEQAHRMLTAGDGVAAVEGILAMAAVPFDPSVIASTPLARDDDAEERLVSCARLVLGSAHTAAQTEDFIVNATKLADELMESAIVATLHSDRPGHAVKLGSTTPDTYTEDDRARVKSQLGQIVEGWLADMGSMHKNSRAALGGSSET